MKGILAPGDIDFINHQWEVFCDYWCHLLQVLQAKTRDQACGSASVLQNQLSENNEG